MTQLIMPCWPDAPIIRVSGAGRLLEPRRLIRERPMRDGVTLRRTVSGVIRCSASERSPRDVTTAWAGW
jgi:hypothetical protein